MHPRPKRAQRYGNLCSQASKWSRKSGIFRGRRVGSVQNGPKPCLPVYEPSITHPISAALRKVVMWIEGKKSELVVAGSLRHLRQNERERSALDSSAFHCPLYLCQPGVWPLGQNGPCGVAGPRPPLTGTRPPPLEAE